MSINSAKDFFEKKHTWSIIKDKLLSWYLLPYLSKIMMATNTLYLIDGFAGPGLFGDGQKGSPIIEAELLEQCYQKTKNKRIEIHLICVEKDKTLFEELERNTRDIPFIDLYNDSLENVLPFIMDNVKKNAAVFLYLDPFGVKGLPVNLETIFAKRRDLKIELLLNFNSFGCFRECKRLVGDNEFNDFFEENSYLVDSKSTPQRMDAMLGTSRWREFIKQKNHEYLLSVSICDKFKRCFKYTLNMPVKNTKNDVLKYRMIHCTNSANGAILMADNMFAKMNESKISLFNTDLEGNIVEASEMIPYITKFIPFFPNKPIRLNELLMMFYENVGVMCPTKDLKDYLRTEENLGRLFVSRIPPTTGTGQKPHFWSEDNGRIVKIVRKISI